MACSTQKMKKYKEKLESSADNEAVASAVDASKRQTQGISINNRTR